MNTSENKLPVNIPTLMLLLALLVGSAFRLTPLLSGEERLLQQWPTEDGYLMLTIARNMGLNKGMSVANGEIPTNGTQPLTTWLYSQAYKWVNGDKAEGVYWALMMQCLFSWAGIFVIFRVLKSLLLPWIYAERAAAFTAATWFVSTIFISHSMNCLESGLWMVAVTTAIGSWHHLLLHPDSNSVKVRVPQAALLGVILGLCTWIRIDAVFVIAAITLTHVASRLLISKSDWVVIKNAFLESCIIGIMAIAVVSPWLLHNKLNFGAFVPISGTAQSVTQSFGGHAGLIPVKLFEFAYMAFGVPDKIENNLFVQLLCAAAVFVWLLGLPQLVRKATATQKTVLMAACIMAIAYISYYGLFFGAPHFLARYLLPIGLIQLSLSSVYVFSFLQSLQQSNFSWGKPLTYAMLFLFVLSVLGQNIRVYVNAIPHQHWQVIEWTRNNVPETSWVGAVQTGTLGYFHDRTLNLDGKVNPAALQAKLQKRIPNYIVESDIMYLVDWIGIAHWIKLSPLTEHFALVVRDQDKNLGVLQRVVEK